MSQGARQTHQRRSKETRDKLLNSLESLLKEKDFAEIGVTEIAANAGVSAASIYRRFDRKEGFIPVLFDLYIERLEEWTHRPEARMEVDPDDMQGAFRSLAQTAWLQITEQAHILRAIQTHGRQHMVLLAPRVADFEATALAGIKQLLGVFEHKIMRDDFDKSARMISYFFNNILMEKLLFGADGAGFGTPDDMDTFCGEIADFAYGYLTTPNA